MTRIVELSAREILDSHEKKQRERGIDLSKVDSHTISLFIQRETQRPKTRRKGKEPLKKQAATQEKKEEIESSSDGSKARKAELLQELLAHTTQKKQQVLEDTPSQSEE